MIEQLFTGWVQTAIKDAPILVGALIAAWDLRGHFLACQQKMEEMHQRAEDQSEKLLTMLLDRSKTQQ